MTQAPLEQAVCAFDARFGAGAAESRIDRVEIERGVEGALLLTERTPEKTRWFRGRGAELEEIFPENERRLPYIARHGIPGPVLAWRPGKSMVVAAGDEAGAPILKALRPRSFEKSIVVHRAAHRASSSELRLPRVLEEVGACGDWTGDACLRLEQLPGHRLRMVSGAEGEFEQLGRGLAVFRSGCEVEGEHTLADEIELVERLAARGLGLCGLLPRSFDAALLEVRARARQLEPCTAVATHRDLHDGQVLVDENGRVSLLDLDTLTTADAALDPGNFAAHLQLRQLQGLVEGDESVAASLSRAFLNGIEPKPTRGYLAALSLYTAIALLRLSIVYHLRPRWAHVANDLVVAAQQQLGQREFV